jgi:hypothetical protein
MPFTIVMLVPVSNIDTLKELADTLVEHPEIAVRIISDEDFQKMIRSVD